MRQNNRSGYWFRERETKKSGTVVDVYFYIVGEDGREKQKCIGGFENKTLAKKAYFDFMHTYVAPPKKVAYKQKYTVFEDAFKQYLAYGTSVLADSSYLQLKGYYENHYKYAFVSKNIEKITAQDIYQWQDKLLTKISEKTGRPYADKTIENIVARLSAFFEWAVARYNITNPMADTIAPKKRSQKTEMQIWELSEFNIFINNIEDIKWKTFFMSMYFSGCRIGEMLALTESDYIKDTLHIVKSLSKKTVNGDNYRITSTKNKKNRWVPLPKLLTLQLNEYLIWKRQNGISDKFLFVGEAGDYLSHTTIRRKFDEYTNLAKLNRIRVHDLRHSYVSLLIHKGVNLAVIADLIGDTLDQITKTYGHMYVSDKVKAITLLDS